MQLNKSGRSPVWRWPNDLADRDAANLSRDALTDFLVQFSLSEDRPIVLVAHSIGAYLAMEAALQIAWTGHEISEHLCAVVLISPDIDMAVFWTQFDVHDPKLESFIVLAFRSDRALRLSSQLSGRSERLGSPEDFDCLRELGVVVVDL